jgi:uncharacterized protein YcbX
MGTVAAIYRHPVKGLSPEPLETVTVAPGRGLPFDRVYALTNGRSDVGSGPFEWHPKSTFLMLQRDDKLATLQTRFDDDTRTLTVMRDGKQVAKGNLTLPVGRAMIEDFFAAYLNRTGGQKPKLVQAPEGAMYSDHKAPVVSIHNLNTLKDLERVAGTRIDPLRFRANVWIDGVDAWEEFNWLGKEIRLGPVRLRVKERIDRCAATNVDPATGARDMNIPKLLQHGFGHIDFGVFAEVMEGGTFRVGDAVETPSG